MRRKFAFSALAVAALMAAVVGPASASAAEIHAESEPVIFEGQQTVKNVFSINSGIFNCQVATFKGGEETKTTSALKLIPTYKQCRIFGVKADPEINGCSYLLHAGDNGVPDASVDIVCPAGNSVEVQAIGIDCVVAFGSQADLGSMTFSNQGSGASRFLNVDFHLSGIEYDEAGGECVGGPGENNGTYTGQAEVKGYQDVGGVKGAQQGIWVE